MLWPVLNHSRWELKNYRSALTEYSIWWGANAEHHRTSGLWWQTNNPWTLGMIITMSNQAHKHADRNSSSIPLDCQSKGEYNHCYFLGWPVTRFFLILSCLPNANLFKIPNWFLAVSFYRKSSFGALVVMFFACKGFMAKPKLRNNRSSNEIAKSVAQRLFETVVLSSWST